jgi:hypothetical protein
MFDVKKQTFTILFDGAIAVRDTPFLTHANQVRIFQFDTFSASLKE